MWAAIIAMFLPYIKYVFSVIPSVILNPQRPDPDLGILFLYVSLIASLLGVVAWIGVIFITAIFSPPIRDDNGDRERSRSGQ
jgi:hypothetical protein